MPSSKQQELLRNAAPTERSVKKKKKSSKKAPKELSDKEKELLKNVSPSGRKPSSEEVTVRMDDIYFPSGHAKAGELTPFGLSQQFAVGAAVFEGDVERSQATGKDVPTMSELSDEAIRITEENIRKGK